MNVYLDTSALNRIFDDQSQPRIYLEASAMLLIFGLIEQGVIPIVSSEALELENSRNPYEERRIFVHAILRKAKVFQTVNDRVVKRALEIQALGLQGLDAMHLACAEKMRAGYFVTCDDKISRRYEGSVAVINPVEFSLRMLNQEVNNADS